MSNYTPAEYEILDGYPMTDDELARGIARITVNALREAAEAIRREAPGEPHEGATFGSFADWLEARADQIKQEAGCDAG